MLHESTHFFLTRLLLSLDAFFSFIAAAIVLMMHCLFEKAVNEVRVQIQIGSIDALRCAFYALFV